ncbi:glycyl-radical enzyme activating protein [Clostridium lacusfryxellense]|uniref:glycyl-radical enzyme activating protein n=1 Tax=Clostridium lacusfryxellense TaxID=205328 RepID=UPI001C0D2D2F|nr:glycyl-radical enzyme activating protein [Clostridium lacusfryxellense]MBU3113265.1 glycyl-radical enzyme activating protein [Clostridium lacusfryxellense]
MIKKGNIFDIQRFSLYDGPGIRTTVFLKGCPLRCIWCHNPESWHLKSQLMFNKEKCTNCGECSLVCPTGAQIMKNNIHEFLQQKCNKSFKCVDVCSYGALKISGLEKDVQAVMKEVAADITYYDNSGGGLTISGGEPTVQWEFTLELLKVAKQMNIHTAIETCGFGQQEVFNKIRNYTDLFLFDIKDTGSARHEKLTGVSNIKILKNLDFLYNQGSEIILRCPMIPGINDTTEHLRGISALSRKYPNLKGIEILPYHDMGRGKWKEMQVKYTLEGLKMPDDKTKKGWMDTLIRKMGCHNAVLL